MILSLARSPAFLISLADCICREPLELEEDFFERRDTEAVAPQPEGSRNALEAAQKLAVVWRVVQWQSIAQLIARLAQQLDPRHLTLEQRRDLAHDLFHSFFRGGREHHRESVAEAEPTLQVPSAAQQSWISSADVLNDECSQSVLYRTGGSGEVCGEVVGRCVVG